MFIVTCILVVSLQTLSDQSKLSQCIYSRQKRVEISLSSPDSFCFLCTKQDKLIFRHDQLSLLLFPPSLKDKDSTYFIRFTPTIRTRNIKSSRHIYDICCYCLKDMLNTKPEIFPCKDMNNIPNAFFVSLVINNQLKLQV